MKDEELLRYSRHIMLPALDIVGQERILASQVLIVGLGGLGSPVAMYLAAAGVGRLTLVDFDEVDLSNLQRQIAHTEIDLGLSKAQSAASSAIQINQGVQVTAVTQKLSEADMAKLVEQHDATVDCTDNFATRQLLNRLAVVAKKPLISGAAVRMEGQVSVYDMRDEASPCYHCVYGEQHNEDLSCAEGGVLAPVVGVIGSIQAIETLKCIAKIGSNLKGRLLLFDAFAMEWQTIHVKKNEQCSVCAQ